MQNIYAALLLHKLGKAVDEEGMKKVLQAAGAEVDESSIKTLIASLKGVDIDKALEEAKAAPVAAAAPAAEEKKEEPKEEKKEASAEGLAALFG
ncbi:50S ribosomal protein L12 [Nanoarchaeota archaeon]